MNIQPLTEARTIEILCSPREIPLRVTADVEIMLERGEPIVDPERFTSAIIGLTVAQPPDAEQSRHATYRKVVELSSSSTLMAWQMAGDIAIPRPRRLYEHTQSVLNTYAEVFSPLYHDPRHRLLGPMFALQDIGKAHCVAMADVTELHRSRNQEYHNKRITQNVLGAVPEAALSQDEKTVIGLLVAQSTIGRALAGHAEKGKPVDEAIAPAQAQLDVLRTACPDDYRDSFDDYLIVSYLADAGAHTQQAHYIAAGTGQICADVLPEDRFNSDGSETGNTLDRLFADTTATVPDLRLYRPGHLAVMHALFPNHYEAY